jgi:hypothetical protein
LGSFLKAKEIAMASGVGSIGGVQGSTFSSPVAVTAQNSSAAQNAPSYIKTAAGSLQNPRIVLDPQAGFVTEYLSANGSDVIEQSPSAVTVAYLRLGLTANGLSKQPSEPSPHIATTA